MSGRLHEATRRTDLEILDRIGGDSLVAGLIYVFLTGRGPEIAVAQGAAHGAPRMTTPGDISMATLTEVERLVAGGMVSVVRQFLDWETA